jgi:Large polyvalent protein associated domain 23
MSNNFLNMLLSNPYGWGNGPGPGPEEPMIAFMDDAGNPYGLDNKRIEPNKLQNALSRPTEGDMTYRSQFLPVATYANQSGGDSLGLAMPQLALDAWEAINAPGQILNEGMTADDRGRTATNAAGFMMGGGLVAPRPKNALASGGGRIADDGNGLSPIDYIKAPYKHLTTPSENVSQQKIDLLSEIARLEQASRYSRQTVGAQKHVIDRMENSPDLFNDFGVDGVTPYDAALMNKQIRQRKIDDGTLYSNGSKPGAGVGAALINGSNDGFTLNMFGGSKAKTADLAKLAMAEDMAARNAPREQIWNETGWFQGVDGKWRFEIDDTQAKLMPSMRAHATPLSRDDISKLSEYMFGKNKDDLSDGEIDKLERVADIKTQIGNALLKHPREVNNIQVNDFLDHSKLFDAYPSLAETSLYTKINKKPETEADLYGGASYDPRRTTANSGRIDITTYNNNEGALSAVLHELQHAIQETEGFAVGANHKDLNYDFYAGEVEAKNVQSRLKHQRSAKEYNEPMRAPWKTQRFKDDQQIINLYSNASPLGSAVGNALIQPQQQDDFDLMSYLNQF